MKWNKYLALLLALVLTLTMVPAVEGESDAPAETAAVTGAEGVSVQATTWPSDANNATSIGEKDLPKTLSNGSYLLSGTFEYQAPTGKSPITVPKGVSATLIINGNITLHGADASGTTGATAAIRVEEGATLTIYSYHDRELSTSTAAPKDTLTVYGGNAAAGTNGTDATKDASKSGSVTKHTWTTGSGGTGGGGAAAAIGGNGGTGGSGASGWLCLNNGKDKNDRGQVISVDIYGGPLFGSSYNHTDDNPGKDGDNGEPGTAGTGTGTIYIPGRLTLVAKGGSAAAGGKGGSGCEGMYNLSNADDTVGGCGGGGGGGGGCAAPAIGPGGAGGSGGGSGGQLSSDHKGKIAGCGGGGGGGGWPNGGGGGGGGTTASESGSGANHSGGAGGNGGAAGSTGSTGSSGRTGNSAVGSTASGGAGGGGVQSGAASGGSGGVRVQSKSEYPGGKGGNGGAAVSNTAWHTAGKLLLSTANNLKLDNGSLGYGYGDGQGYGTCSPIAPYIVYDLMDCSVTVSGSYTYTGAAIQPAKSNVTIKYSASSDRDGARVSSVDTTITNFTLSYGANIHCPAGTLTATGGNDAERATVRKDNAVVGAKTANFTINKATLTRVDISAASYELKMAAGASASEETELILGKYYESTAASDTKKNDLHIVWRDAFGTKGWPTLVWNPVTANGGVKNPQSNPDNSAKPKFYALYPGSYQVQLKLTGMNDFNDYTQNLDLITVRSSISATLSPNPVHPRQETVTVGGIPAAAKATVTWYRGSTQVGTGLTYAPTNADAGRTLTAKIVPTAPYYLETDLTVKVENHSYNNGFCSVCGEYQKPSGSSTAGYTIRNGGQLFWFAAQVNGDSTHAGDVTGVIRSINGTLANDIDLQNPADTKAGKTTEWTPMGSTTGKGTEIPDQYSGTFNGNGHTIKGMSITTSDARTGLFADAGTGAVIKNFTIEGNITLTKTNSGTNAGVGGAVGYMYMGEVSDVTSKVTIQNGANDEALVHVGGVVGGTHDAAVTIRRCIFEGSISVYNSHDCIGGVVGYANSKTVIEYCANRGTVKANSPGLDDNTDPYLGGILGYVYNNSTVVKNCYNYGTVSCGNYYKYCGAIVGRMRNIESISDCYFLRGSALKSVGTYPNGSTFDTSTLPQVKSKTQFASGEVCYLVNGKVSTAADGAVWMQNVDNGKTPYDIYPVFTSDPVYALSDGRYSNTPETVQVTITWGSMHFVCSDDWDPATHTYGVQWVPAQQGGDQLTVTNESNVDVKAAFAFTPTLEGLSGSFTDAGPFRLARPGSGTTSKTVRLDLASTTRPGLTSKAQIGSVKVTISAAG